MSQRIQHKRSSIEGRRPSSQYLEPGELALNTNQADPGLFFETNTGEIAKVGPTYIGMEAPISEVGYGPGEQWFDSGNGTLNLWVPALNKWVPALSPIFGGAQTAIFVGSEFPEATDDLSNDGYARPFATLNRAMLEVARRSVLAGRADDVFNSRFSVVLLPGRNVAYNEPGVSLESFESGVTAFTRDQPINQDTLRKFNSVSGGLMVPRGTSIFGLDLRKTIIVPTYYPDWTRQAYETAPESIEPRTSIFKWTGNCYLNSFTFNDKVSQISVTGIDGDSDDPAVLLSLRPHGFRALITSSQSSNEVVAGDRITMTYPAGVSRDYDGESTLPEGEFWAEPLDPFRFRIRKVAGGTIVLRNELPKAGVPGSSPANYLDFTYTNSTHHRLSSIKFATAVELNEYYAKAQRAFANLNFSGTINNAEVAPGETTIVAPTPQPPAPEVDTVTNGSPYLFNVSLRSEWGLCGMEVDGSLVGGFKSALTCNYTSVSLQNDADVYEVYEDGEWISLKQSYVNAQNAGAVEPITLADVTNDEAIGFLLTNVKVENIRYFLRSAEDIPGEDGKSSGLPDEKADTRHFVVQASNNGYAQIVASFAIGVAINYWAKSGGQMSVTNANSNFGGIALRAEGFSGIGTTGGAEPADTGFTVQGVRRPAAVTKQMVAGENIKKFYLNSRITATTATSITLSEPFDPTAIQPYTLKPGTAIWVEDFDTGSTYSAILSTTAAVVQSGGLQINLDSSNNNIHTAVSGGVSVSQLSLPFLRRFVDPRPVVDRTYALWIRNTDQNHRPPEAGTILRFAEKPSSGVSNLLTPGKQLDPGKSGGWGHLFQVIDARTKREGDNPNLIEPMQSPIQGTTDYYVTLAPVDQFHPWVSAGNNGFSTGTAYYPKGYYATYSERPFYPMENDLESVAASKPIPTNVDSVWTRAKNYEYCQLIDQAWMHGSGYTSADDTFTAAYTGTGVVYTYPRGLQYDPANYGQQFVVDADSGAADLGIVSGGLGDPTLVDPWWAPTKAAMTRFLALLGYSYSNINTVLTPQLWSTRNLASTSLPAVGTTGYALSTGTWPVEFNRPSTIRCGNHTWEWCGFLNYAKGLPKYQESQLSLRQRFDFVFTALWGGVIYANGNTERGEFVLTGKTVAGGTGAALVATDMPLPSFGVQNVSA